MEVNSLIQQQCVSTYTFDVYLPNKGLSQRFGSLKGNFEIVNINSKNEISSSNKEKSIPAAYTNSKVMKFKERLKVLAFIDTFDNTSDLIKMQHDRLNYAIECQIIEAMQNFYMAHFLKAYPEIGTMSGIKIRIPTEKSEFPHAKYEITHPLITSTNKVFCYLA
jgi:hypothetical protein